MVYLWQPSIPWLVLIFLPRDGTMVDPRVSVNARAATKVERRTLK